MGDSHLLLVEVLALLSMLVEMPPPHKLTRPQAMTIAQSSEAHVQLVTVPRVPSQMQDCQHIMQQLESKLDLTNGYRLQSQKGLMPCAPA